MTPLVHGVPPLDLVIVGVGGHAREALDVVEATNRLHERYRVIGWLDDDPHTHGTRVRGYPVLGATDWLARASADVRYFIGIGSCATRARIAGALERLPHRAEALVHPAALMGSNVRLGRGCLIGPGVVVTTDVELGRHTHLNIASTVSHDCIFGEFVHIAPGAHIAGNVRIECGSDVGVGASIIHARTIGEWSVVGAGAAVIHDVEANVTVAGVPARVISRRAAGWNKNV